MILNRNLILALTLTGSVVAAAVLAVQRNARRLEAARHQTALQVWENETGSVMAPAIGTLPL